jgi:uncharacterized protein with GYD domain
MATYIMFGKYSSVALKGISAKRTTKAKDLIKKFGGKVESLYALLGEIDLVFTVDFPDAEQAMKASIALAKLTGISFSTSPAVTIDEFDKMLAKA